MSVDYEVSDSIAVITLNRPDVLNAFNQSMVGLMTDALDAADRDDEVHSVIITGRGRAFCAGADLSGDDRFDGVLKAPQAVPRDGGGEVTLRIFGMHKPVIAAINGAAVGVGATMILPADFRLASSTARFGFVFARRGINMESCSSWFLPRLVGLEKSLEWVYTGRVFGADEALSAGLIRSIHEPDDLLPAARAFAHELRSASSSVSLAACRQLMWRMLGAPHPVIANRIESRTLNVLMRSGDAAEGVASFLEKRDAVFRDQVSTELPPDLFDDWPPPAFPDWR